MSRDVVAGRAFVKLALSGRAQLEQGIKSVGNHIRSIAGLATKLTATLGAIGVGAGFIASIKAASDMEETMSKFNVVFGESSEVMKKWSDDLAATVGRSKNQIASFLASAQDLLVPLGFDPSQAQELSKQITQLAIDLGSFNNIADEDVFRDLQAALTGSGEVMKKYGVVVNEARVKQELLNQKIDPKFATEAEKAMARYSLILQGTTAAHGDAIRTGDSFANQWKRLVAEIDNAKVLLGEQFLPAVTSLVSSLSEAVLVMGQFAANATDGADSMTAMTLSTESLLNSISGLLDFLANIVALTKAVRAEIKRWSADWSETIEGMVAMSPFGPKGFMDAFREELKTAAAEARAAAEQLDMEADVLLDRQGRAAELQNLLQKIQDERARSAAGMSGISRSVFMNRPAPHRPAPRPPIASLDPVAEARTRHPSVPAGRSYEAGMAMLAELKRVEQNTRALIPSLDAVEEGTLEAARAAHQNEQNALLLRELEETRRQTAHLQRMATVLSATQTIGVLRL